MIPNSCRYIPLPCVIRPGSGFFTVTPDVDCYLAKTRSTAVKCLNVTRRGSNLAVGLLLAVAGLAAATAPWTTFSSRGGWSISYPSDWRIASCKSCSDPKAPGVFVDFFSPRQNREGGWVMVEQLADKPPSRSVDEWLSNIATSANVNPHIRDEKFVLNNLPALKVRYRTAHQSEMEEVYVLSGSKTFSVTFGEDSNPARVPLEQLTNYPVYVKMLASFRALESKYRVTMNDSGISRRNGYSERWRLRFG
jgi:hypothetical protein